MIYCKYCIHWMDESLEQIEADRNAHPHIFMGCRIFGNTKGTDQLQNCEHYEASRDTFAICVSCRLTVPKLCISLGECVNCTDTDLFCIDSCMGGEHRKYCSHFVRLHTDGIQLIDKNQVFDLFPKMGMPGQDKSNAKGDTLKKSPKETSSKKDS